MAVYNCTCDICNQNFKAASNRRKICDTCVTQICPVCGEENTLMLKLGLCHNCVNKTKEEYGNLRFLSYCEKHDEYYRATAHNHLNCKYCKKEAEDEERERLERRKELKEKQSYRDCVICKNKFKFKESKHTTVCDNCYDNTDKTLGTKYLVYCDRCDFYYFCNHNLTTCPKCKLHSFKKECKECGKTFIANHSSVEICDYCMKPFSVRYCDQLMNDHNNIIKDGFILTPIEIKEGKLIRQCEYCNRNFSIRSGPHNLCGCCYRIRTCSYCGENYVRTRSNLSPVNSKRSELGFCSLSCRSANSQKEILSMYDKLDHLQIFNNLPDEFKFVYNCSLEDLQEISPEDSNLYKLQGIWCKIDAETGELLDVSLTTNIQREMNKHLQSILKQEGFKAQELYKRKLIFKLVTKIKDLKDGFIKEMSFALQFKAKYWYPAPGIQVKLINKIRKDL